MSNNPAAKTASAAEKVPPAVQAEKAKKAPATKEEVKERVQAKRRAFAQLVTFAKENAEKLGNLEMLNLAKQFEPKARAIDEPRWTNQLRGLFGDKSTLHEDTLWREHKIGRSEMQSLIKDAVIREKPEHRVWVVFDLPNGTYRILGLGAVKPEGWPISSPLPREMKAR